METTLLLSLGFLALAIHSALRERAHRRLRRVVSAQVEQASRQLQTAAALEEKILAISATIDANGQDAVAKLMRFLAMMESEHREAVAQIRVEADRAIAKVRGQHR